MNDPFDLFHSGHIEDAASYFAILAESDSDKMIQHTSALMEDYIANGTSNSILFFFDLKSKRSIHSLTHSLTLSVSLSFGSSKQCWQSADRSEISEVSSQTRQHDIGEQRQR